jgi:sec-independent protein translocase protein TatB
VFANLGWDHLLVLLIAALVILGPERLPGAIGWVSRGLRQFRDYMSTAAEQVKDDFGPEFEDLRQPLADLQRLRGTSPRALIVEHLLDGDDTLLTGAQPDTAAWGSGTVRAAVPDLSGTGGDTGPSTRGPSPFDSAAT